MTEDRFERQADLVPRERLEPCRVTVIGCGAIGRQVAIQLASMGVVKLQLIDFDSVEETNITTQGWLSKDIGGLKTDVLAANVREIDPDIEVETIVGEFSHRHIPGLGNIVFCCVDSIVARAKIWNLVKKWTVDFWCDGRMMGETIHVLTSDLSKESMELYDKTLFPPEEAQEGACTGRGVIYTANIAAGFMLQQFTRWLRRYALDSHTVLNLLSNEVIVMDGVESGLSPAV